MQISQPTLYLLCGKIAAGKSTFARRLAERQATVLVSEDNLMAHLFLDQVKTIDDYDRFSGRLRAVVGPHVIDLLRHGLSVILDFPANTVGHRRWMRSLINGANVGHELHWLDVPDAICKQRLLDRNAAGEHPFQATEEEYELFTSYFEPPGIDEGFNLIVHSD